MDRTRRRTIPPGLPVDDASAQRARPPARRDGRAGPSDAEVAENPRVSSARLRAAEKLPSVMSAATATPQRVRLRDARSTDVARRAAVPRLRRRSVAPDARPRSAPCVQRGPARTRRRSASARLAPRRPRWRRRGAHGRGRSTSLLAQGQLELDRARAAARRARGAAALRMRRRASTAASSSDASPHHGARLAIGPRPSRCPTTVRRPGAGPVDDRQAGPDEA